MVLFSPWVDVALREVPAAEPRGEAMLSVAWAAACAAHYLRDTSPDAPQVSPLFADLRGLPPTLIQAGTDELLHGQALQLEAALQADAEGLVRIATLFDIYKPKEATADIQAGERSLAVRLELLDDGATLTDERIDSAVAAALLRVQTTFGARLRG